MHFFSAESLLTQTSPQPPGERGPAGLALTERHLPPAYMKGI